MPLLNQTSSPDQPPLPTFAVILLSVPAILIILLTVFGNLLVLFFKARVGRTNTTLLVWNLGLTDFLVGLFVLPIGAIYLIHRKWVFGRLMCRIWVGADVTFCTCSVVTICVISADRYLAVTRPLRYKSLITKFKIVAVIICIWIFSLGILLSTVRWDSGQDSPETCFAGHEIRYLAHSVVFAFFLPASVTLTLYWRIYRLARNRQRALDRGFLMILGRNMNFLTNTLSQTTALRVHVGKNNGMVEQQRRVLRTHERIAKTLGVVSCSFLFCWLPFFTLYLLNFQCEGCLPSLVIDIASWLGYCNSMINPIIYSFTVKEFKRSTLSAVYPFWFFVYRKFPKYICKPPDPRASQRIARRKQQLSKMRQKRENALLPPEYDFVKRRIPPKERAKGAIASLMVNTNCSIAQNLLTSAAITRDVGMTTGHKLVGLEQSSAGSISNGVKKAILNNNNRLEMDNQLLVEEEEESGSRLKGRRFTIEEDVKRLGEGTDLLNRNGLVTATLLLATSKRMYRDFGEEKKRRQRREKTMMMEEEEAYSLPPTLSPGSDESSPTRRAYRMPCKISMKKLKRHSLPDTSAVTTGIGGRRRANELLGKGARGGGWRREKGGQQQQPKGVLPQFRKKEVRGNERKNSPSGLWQKATARAIALRDQFIMSKSSSFGSLSSAKRKEKTTTDVQVEEEEEGQEDVDVENGSAVRKGEKHEASLNEAICEPKSGVNLIKEKVGWMFKSFEEEQQNEGGGGGGGEEEGRAKFLEVEVHILCLTDEVAL